METGISTFGPEKSQTSTAFGAVVTVPLQNSPAAHLLHLNWIPRKNTAIFNPLIICLYAIVCSGTIRPNSDFTVVASVHESKVPAKIKISIAGPKFCVDKIVEVQPYSLEKIPFQIPFIENGRYKITTVGLAGIHFRKRAKLYYSEFYCYSLIQTDKSAYKPGDLVRFKILILDKQTSSAKIDEPISISITDPQQNIIKQIDNAELKMGVFSNELQLSQFPNLGQWEVVVKYGKENDAYYFEVEKYVLPKFEVTIDTPKHILLSDGKIKTVVRAK